MTAPLPRAVASGVMHIDKRKIRVANLSDGRRVMLDLPVVGMLDGAPEEALEDGRVYFRAEDGTEANGFDVRLIVMLAKAIAEANDPDDCEGDERRIALECRAFVMLCAQHGRRVMGVEGTGVLS